jgi:threonine dehydrogenase-like Zn-dependent dehydrogenase
MLAAVTEGVRAIALRERPEPPEPGPGEVLLAPAAVGICGSDYHFYLGELSEAAGGAQFPRIQGHEVCARIVALGPGCREQLRVGQLVAIWPLQACGECYPCRVGRPNTCDRFRLIGIHTDGGLQERLAVAQQQAYPISCGDPAVAALAEPMSIAVRALARARLTADEQAVVLGAGPIGQCICLLARERGARVLAVDVRPERLRSCAALGAEVLPWRGLEPTVRAARAWAPGSGGSPVAIDASGAPEAVRAMVELCASAGRAVQVGMSSAEVALRIGSLTEKELDLLGVSCATAAEFAQAVAVVERNAPALARLISDRFPLREAPEALRFASENPGEVIKVVIENG